jgi:hypothetical protein
MAFRLRNPELALAFCGFLVAFSVTLTAIIVVRHRASDHAAANHPSPVHVHAGDGPLRISATGPATDSGSARACCAFTPGSSRVGCHSFQSQR